MILNSEIDYINFIILIIIKVSFPQSEVYGALYLLAVAQSGSGSHLACHWK